MVEINVREARKNLKALLDRVAAGEEVLIRRRGEPVARLVPPAPAADRRLPGLAEHRTSIAVEGGGLSRAVIAEREEERA